MITSEQQIVVNELINPQLNNWKEISKFAFLSKEFMEKYKNKIHWDLIVFNPYLTEELMDIFFKYLEPSHLLIVKKLSIKFIEKHIKEFLVYNGLLFQYQKLTLNFISKYGKNHMDVICEYQKLTEKFMDKNFNKLDWNKISRYQTLSESFIMKHKDKLNIPLIKEYQTLSQEFLKTI